MTTWKRQNWCGFFCASLLISLSLTEASWGQPIQPVPSVNQSVPVRSVPSDYLLGPGDQVEILVFSYDEFTSKKTVLPDGTITLPIIGSVQAAGLTAEGLRAELRQRLDSLLVNPVVTVNLASLRSVVVNVAGEVERPGPIQLEGGDKSTLIAALSSAGGVTQYADIRSVTLERTVPDGSTTSRSFDLWELLSANTVPPDLILQDGDSIHIPRLAADQTLDRRLIARSSLAPDTIRVRVVGEVKRPGEVQVSPDGTLSSAVAIAGGPTEDARLSTVAFIRLNEQGQVEEQVVDLRNLTDTYQVQDGDVIVVPKRNVSNVLDFASRILGPVGAILNLFRFF